MTSAIHSAEALRFRLYEAAGKGDLPALRRAIADGAEIDGGEDAALSAAAGNGHTAAVVLLLEHGADIHADDNGALHYAVQNGHRETVSLLLTRGADIHADGDYALFAAVNNQDSEMVRLLLQYDADPNVGDGAAYLQLAAESGDVDTMRHLLRYGAKLHAGNENALKWAIREAKPEAIVFLLEQGADLRKIDVVTLDYLLSRENNLEAVTCLLTHGSYAREIGFFGNRALLKAVEESDVEAVARLLDCGVDLHASNNDAFHIARRNSEGLDMQTLYATGKDHPIETMAWLVGAGMHSYVPIHSLEEYFSAATETLLAASVPERMAKLLEHGKPTLLFRCLTGARQLEALFDIQEWKGQETLLVNLHHAARQGMPGHYQPRLDALDRSAFAPAPDGFVAALHYDRKLEPGKAR